MMAYMMLALLIVPFVQFVRYFFEKEHSKLCDMICAITILETILLFVMHITNIWEFRQSAWMIHGLMFVALWYMAFCVRERIHQYGADRKVKINAIAVGALAVSIVVDMIAFYMDVQRTDVLGKIGILIYILLLGKECYADAFAKIQEGEKAESYLQLAMTDVMTGLMNRSAFEEWEDKCTDLSDVMIVTFDLNNLKYCNDHLGHKAGDEYIIEAANMISRVFGAVGQCYRIGGDEFCAVILKASHFNIEKYLDRLREEQDYFNRESEQVKIHIAVGYALHENCDEDMEQTRSRADAFMYRNKNKMKINGER
jgi:diguanylate cyclase (GGDEF)-like protein